jgi:hypothetical protein
MPTATADLYVEALVDVFKQINQMREGKEVLRNGGPDGHKDFTNSETNPSPE